MRRNGVRAPILMLTARRRRGGHDPRPRLRRQRLHHQAIPPQRAAGAAPRAAPPARAVRGRGLHHRPLHASARAPSCWSTRAARKKVRLTEKETAILKYLYRAGDRIIGRDVLLNEVWGYNSGVTTHTLETHVYRLRQKIERDPGQAPRSSSPSRAATASSPEWRRASPSCRRSTRRGFGSPRSRPTMPPRCTR